MKPNVLNRMAVDKRLSLKLAIMTGVGLFIALITPMILDPKLIWQQVTVVGTTAYLVFVLSVVAAVYTSASSELTNQGERVLFAVWFIAQTIIYSVWVIIGPLNEAFEMMMSCAERLSTIPKDAE